MNDFNTYEYVVVEKAEGAQLVKKILGRCGLLFIVVAWVIFSFLTYPGFAVLALVLLGVEIYVWKLFNVELEYSMTSGIMTFSRIYGGMRRKKVLDVFIKDMREIAPVTDDTMEHLRSIGVEKDYLFASSASADDMYYATFDCDGRLSVVYFEATEKTLKILRFYNPATVVAEVSR